MPQEVRMNSTKRIALLTGALSLALSAVTATAQPNDHPATARTRLNAGRRQRSSTIVTMARPWTSERCASPCATTVICSRRPLPCRRAFRRTARGKPLPPGIAKNLDNRLLGHLPRYEGYEWKQLGRDVILVAIATGIVYEILENVLD